MNVNDLIIDDVNALAVFLPGIVKGLRRIHAFGVAPTPADQNGRTFMAPGFAVLDDVITKEDFPETVVKQITHCREPELPAALVWSKAMTWPHVTTGINQNYAAAGPARKLGAGIHRV